MAPLFQHGIVGEDADVGAVEAACQHVGFGVAMVMALMTSTGKEISSVDERPVDGVDEGAIGRDPASDDLRVALVADDQIGLAQGLIADDADENDLRAVFGDPANSKFKGVFRLPVDIEAELVARNLGRGCRTGAANSTGLRCSADGDSTTRSGCCCSGTSSSTAGRMRNL